MTSHPTVFHYQTTKKCSRIKANDKNKSIPQSSLDGGILPPGFRPAETDILCGRGKAFASHCGNRNFSETVRENLHRYLDAPRRVQKSKVVASVVAEILQSGARFVKQEKASGRWYQMNEDQAHEKTGHAIRDLIKSRSMPTGAPAAAETSSSGVGSTSSSRSTKTPSKSSLAKKTMLRNNTGPRSRTSTMEPMNALNREFCLSTFDSLVSRNLSMSSTDLLASALAVTERLSECDVPSPAEALPVVCDESLSRRPTDEDLEELDEVEIFSSDDFFAESSTKNDLPSSTSDVEAAFVDDLSVTGGAVASACADVPTVLLAYAVMPTTPSASDFERVYELLSSDDESSVEHEERYSPVPGYFP